MYSHRDHRAYRDVFRLLATAVVATVALLALASVVGSALLGLASLLALVALGLASLAASERLVDRYVRDLRAVAIGGGVSGRLRVEVRSRVGLTTDRRRAGPPSPNVRRGGPDR